MAKPQYFTLEEYFPEAFIEKYQYKLDLWRLVDARLIHVCDALRYRYGPMTINTWKWGGDLHNCGYRPFDCTIGAKFSAHKRGQAADLHPRIPAEEIREEIRKGTFSTQFITVVENTVPWLHVSVENTNWPDKPHFINP